MAQDLARRCGAADEAFFREAMASPAAAETERESRRRLSYGTAGFRREGSTLIGVAFRCGMLAAVRSIALQGRATGLVVTASHNPVEDNGVKLVDGDGGMLHMSWEKHAEAIVSAQNAVDLEQVVLRILAKEEVNLMGGERAGTVLLALDTRPTGPRLVSAAMAGIRAAGAAVVGSEDTLRTTPQLHWQVLATNAGGPCEEKDYYDKLNRACSSLLLGRDAAVSSLVVDCANGVGALKLPSVLPAVTASGTAVTLANTGGGTLNSLCGADFVQKERRLPMCVGALAGGQLGASFDGDADRIVFFVGGSESGGSDLDLLDGDKILCLLAGHLKRCVEGLGGSFGPVAFGCIQTAYANGSSTRYLEQGLGLEVVKTKTGVKHLHAAALAFDLSVYFEANGHGTVLFSPDFLRRLREAKGSGSEWAGHLLEISNVVNPAIGDALSVLLLVLAVLSHEAGGLDTWRGLYADAPSRMLKCVVPDRSAIKTTNAEQRMTQPAALQAKVDDLVAGAELARAFVRPSGTEDVVRIYAEARTQEQADQLATSIEREVAAFFS